MRKGPKVSERVVDKISGKPIQVEYQISPEEAYTGKLPRVHDHIKAWGCKVIAHVARESNIDRHDKLMPTGREGIFMGYDEKTTAHHRVYAPDLHKTIVSSNVRFFENTPGSSIENYQLWVELSNGDMEASKGTYNRLLPRNKRGRPLGQQDDQARPGEVPTVDSIRSEQELLRPVLEAYNTNIYNTLEEEISVLLITLE